MNTNIYKYEDIESDKKSYLYLIGEMRNVYRYKELHTQLLECDQWITMLNRQPIKTEYTADALLALKNIMNHLHPLFKILILMKEKENPI